jgi:hypothetical protein
VKHQKLHVVVNSSNEYFFRRFSKKKMIGIFVENIQKKLDAFKLFYIGKRVSQNIPHNASPAITSSQNTIHVTRDSFPIEFMRNNMVSSSIPEVA